MPTSLPRTIAEASCLIAARALSPVELTRALLERIEAAEPVISSFLTVTGDAALDQARRAESEITNGRRRGALHGIPYGAKDNFETRGIRTTGHSRVYENYTPRESAAVIDRLEAEGAILLGKLALHELAHGGPSFDLPWPPARNPWHPGHFTGGSSSGSGAAVAAGLALFALGSDTGGSVRTPASLCGLVGMKPTFGLVSRYGVLPNCYSLDHCGPLTKTVEDCAIVLQAMSAHDPRDRSSPTCRDTRLPRPSLRPRAATRETWIRRQSRSANARRAMPACGSATGSSRCWPAPPRACSKYWGACGAPRERRSRRIFSRCRPPADGTTNKGKKRQ